VKESKKDLFILTLDGHHSHSRNIKVIECATENRVPIVCLPPHSAHKLQPLGVFFIQSLKTYDARKIEIWLKAHPNRVDARYQITGLVGEAYLKSATAAIATTNGFRKTGLFPFNRHIFKVILEESQRNNTSCLLEITVP
jgi:hypothetical protein